MEQEQIQYLAKYEEELMIKLLNLSVEKRVCSDKLFHTEDLDNMWKTIAPEFMVDAMKNIVDYPNVVIAWAGYIGMALAHLWDKDWNKVLNQPNVYEYLCVPRGFDEMDEYIVEDVLGYRFESETAKGFESFWRSVASIAISQIRHEEIEPQSPMAFHVFARTVKVVYRIGASVELYRLGYKWDKVSV